MQQGGSVKKATAVGVPWPYWELVMMVWNEQKEEKGIPDVQHERSELQP